MKYEVEIIGTEPNVLLEILSRSFHKVSVTPVHEIHGKQNTYVYNSRLSEPPYSRAQVICELWEPKIDEMFYCCNVVGDVWNEKRGKYGNFHTYKENSYKFAPTAELALELYQIRLGKWLPKKGDRFFCSDHLHIDEIAPFDFMPPGGGHHYFSSAKQRDTFIEKQKEREEIKSKVFYDGKRKRTDLAVYGREVYQDENGFLKVR